MYMEQMRLEEVLGNSRNNSLKSLLSFEGLDQSKGTFSNSGPNMTQGHQQAMFIEQHDFRFSPYDHTSSFH